MTEVSGLIEMNQVETASSRLRVLIGTLVRDEFVLVSPDIKAQIERFEKKRRRDLLVDFDSRVAQLSGVGSSQSNSTAVSRGPLASAERLSVRAGEMLRTLAEKYIFKWTPNYRDTLQFIFAKALEELPDSGQLEREITAIGAQFASHSEEIFERGHKFQIRLGLSQDVALIKSISGVQTFLDVVISTYLDSRQRVLSAKEANVLWGLTSAAICGLVRGYGSVRLDGVSGWSLLGENMRSWVPPMGFCRATELLAFFDDFPATERAEDLRLVLGAAAYAVERIAHQFHGGDVLLPRWSRMSGGDRLDVTFSANRGGISRDLLLSCFWKGEITSQQPIRQAQSLRAAAIVGKLDQRVREWVDRGEADGVVDAAGLTTDQHQIHYLSELIFAQIDAHGLREDSDVDPTLMTHNFAGDFPLDDPDFRRQFMVERHSVKSLLQEFEGSVGIHLWCSVRRSGKTTAAQELADASGKSVVVAQTMDRVPREPLKNIFSSRLREAFEAHKELSDDFFVQVVRECMLASTAADQGGRRIVFIIDEYESLFALLDAYVRNDLGLKVMVALPLLSQMVDFATRNLLIFMGQRPDAYLVLSAQNQLSPLVQQYRFPLFDHVNNARDTEFTQLLSYVLSDRLPFDASFATAVFEETSGHPYLTVNLMVDFCDWLIGTKFRITGEALSAQQFTSFVKDRLTPAALKRSPHYGFFHGQMAEYLSERARTEEPWLASIANILRLIADKHPRNFTATFSNYEQWAEPVSVVARMTAARLLTTGSQANFLEEKGGSVLPGIRLLARLAGSAAPTIN
ncbi:MULTISPECIES: hypothetical protein [Ralstonia solanacearum species complex]|uniref:hypothetical protein n=1 Tax=Ralstonia solanacearum species complex TaxID=3116862 RepID=UPI0013C2E858|nr:hypothetical protein [Ralstonia solanacearum]